MPHYAQSFTESSSEFLHFTRKTPKMWYLCNSMARWCRTYLKCTGRQKNSVLKIHDGGWLICLIDPLHHQISRFFDLKYCPPFKILEIEIFNCRTLQRHVLHHAKFCGDRLLQRFCNFCIFLLKYRNSPHDQSRLIWHNFVRVMDNWIKFSNFV